MCAKRTARQSPARHRTKENFTRPALISISGHCNHHYLYKSGPILWEPSENIPTPLPPSQSNDRTRHSQKQHPSLPEIFIESIHNYFFKGTQVTESYYKHVCILVTSLWYSKSVIIVPQQHSISHKPANVDYCKLAVHYSLLFLHWHTSIKTVKCTANLSKLACKPVNSLLCFKHVT